MTKAGAALGFDIGGTFTDFVVQLPTGEIRTEKCLTTPANPVAGVLEGLEKIARHSGVGLDAVAIGVHGTTLAINSLIERKGARTAMVVTRGFADILDFGRELRYDIYDLDIRFPAPLVPRKLRFEVDERLSPRGEVLREACREEVKAVARRIREEGAASVAVACLHAYAHPAHERAIAEILREELPDVEITCSADVLRQVNEFERFTAAAMNAFIKPKVSRYVMELDGSLRQAGFSGKWFVMGSHAGMLGLDAVRDQPIRILESGPVGGVLAAAAVGARCGHRDLVAFDMGGTTAKMCLVEDGVPQLTHDYEVARVNRFARGSGMPLHLPMLDLTEIGAGGGSIAQLDPLGLIRVGPESAGADPGPACYGRGGAQPTVTDANLILGYLNPGYFLGGEFALDVEAARRALETLARRIGRDAEYAASGIFRIATANMAEATRAHLVERGVDPTRHTMVAFGGAGPLHAAHMARSLGMQTVIFPRNAGVLAALGLLQAPLSYNAMTTRLTFLEEATAAALEKTFAALEREVEEVLRGAGARAGGVRYARSLDMRYAGQGFWVDVEGLPPSNGGPGPEAYREALLHRFEAAYRARYGRAVPGVGVEIVNLRVVGTEDRPPPPPGGAFAENPSEAVKGERRIYLPERDAFASVPVYDRYALPPGDAIEGPALVEERECTILLTGDSESVVGEDGSLICRIQKGG